MLDNACASGGSSASVKRVLFTANYIRVVNRFLLPYLKWFQEQGWETWVAANNDHMDGTEAPNYCDYYVRIDFSRSPFSKNTLDSYHQLESLFNDTHFDIIHTHTPIAGVLTRLAARKARRQGSVVIYTAHGFHFYKGAPATNWILWYPVERFMSHFADVLVTINHEDYERAKRFSHCCVEYVPGVGIDLFKFKNHKGANIIRKELQISQNDFVILAVGDLNSNKNHETIVRSLMLLSENYRLLICGEGPLREHLLEVAHETGVSHRVKLLGYRNDIPAVMEAANCLVFPSRREGLPVTVMEAMAVGLPVIASSIRGISPDLITDGADGLLLETASPEEIASKVSLLMNNADLASSLSRHAKEHARDFDIRSLIKRMGSIYESVCQL